MISRTDMAPFVVCLALSACSYGFVEDPSLDQWCGETLCNFSTDAGKIERVGTWHRKDYGVRFVEQGTQISQLSTRKGAECIEFSLIASADSSAQMVMELDFNDDGSIEETRAIPGVRWRTIPFKVAPPPEYDSVRFILRKDGTGEAVVAQLQAQATSGSCGTEPSLLVDGSSCSAHVTCQSGRCVDDKCAAACPEGGCSAGEVCASDDMCASGGCVAKDTLDEDDRLPTEILVCAECQDSTDCKAGVCHLGRCAPCAQSDDCSEGEVCSYTDPFDVASRACHAADDTKRPRGGLCEQDDDCEEGLSCKSYDPKLAPRCGGACPILAEDACPEGQRCAMPGLDRTGLDAIDAFASSLFDILAGEPDATILSPTELWSTAPGRVATCYPAVDEGEACVLHVQCAASSGSCCGGLCHPEPLSSEDCAAVAEP